MRYSSDIGSGNIGGRGGGEISSSEMGGLATKMSASLCPFCEVCSRSNTKQIGGSFGEHPLLAWEKAVSRRASMAMGVGRNGRAMGDKAQLSRRRR